MGFFFEIFVGVGRILERGAKKVMKVMMIDVFLAKLSRLERRCIVVLRIRTSYGEEDPVVLVVLVPIFDAIVDHNYNRPADQRWNGLFFPLLVVLQKEQKMERNYLVLIENSNRQQTSPNNC